MTDAARMIYGDAREALRVLEPKSVQCCVTSPPYWRLRDYGHPNQIGQEDTPQAYVEALVAVFREVSRVLRDDGTLWLNLGDSYVGARGGAQGKNSAFASRGTARTGARVRNSTTKVEGLKNKSLAGIPWRVALALMDDGWILRMDNIWAKPNPTPSSVKDRCTSAHEYVFHFSKRQRYLHDKDAIAEPVAAPRRDSSATHRNARSVWNLSTQGYDGAHFACMPPAVAQRCILAGSRFGDTVLDPFFGSGTVGQVASELGRLWVGVELQEDYSPIIDDRTRQLGLVPQPETQENT